MGLRFFTDQCVPNSVIGVFHGAGHPEMAHYRGRLFLVEPHRIRIRG